MDAWMNFSVLPGVMRLVVCDTFYHINCPYKIRAYNSKGELKNAVIC